MDTSDDDEVVGAAGPTSDLIDHELSEYQDVEFLHPSPDPPPEILNACGPIRVSDHLKHFPLRVQEHTFENGRWVVRDKVYGYNETKIESELIEEKVNDSVLSSVHYASSSEEADEESHSSEDTVDPEPEIFYHSVVIRGRGRVAVFRSKRAPAYKLYYYTASGSKAYVKPSHMESFMAVKFINLNTDGIEEPTGYHASRHKEGGQCWCRSYVVL